MSTVPNPADFLIRPPAQCYEQLLSRGCNYQYSSEELEKASQAFFSTLGLQGGSFQTVLNWMAGVIFLPLLVGVLILIWVLAGSEIITLPMALFATVYAFIFLYGPFLALRIGGPHYLQSAMNNNGKLIANFPGALSAAACSLTCDGCWTCTSS